MTLSVKIKAKEWIALLLTLAMLSCTPSTEEIQKNPKEIHQTQLKNERLTNHLFLERMYENECFPDPLVDQVKAILLELCFKLENFYRPNPKIIDSLANTAEKKIHALENMFPDKDREFKMIAEKAIAGEFAFISRVYYLPYFIEFQPLFDTDYKMEITHGDFELIGEAYPFSYIVEFYPSFEAPCVIEIAWNGKSGQVKLTVLDQKAFPSCVGFQENQSLSEADMVYCFDGLKGIDLLKMRSPTRVGLDGIGVCVHAFQASRKNRFCFWSPEKATQEHKIIETIFGLARRSFVHSQTLEYLKDLEPYFRLGS